MKLLRTGISIDAAPRVVWDVLVDFDAFGAWNPFITSIRGRLRVGERLDVVFAPPGRSTSRMRPEITRVTELEELRWQGSNLPSSLFHAEHAFLLEPFDGGRTLFRQRAEHRGVLVAWMDDILRDTRRGFERMSRALKERAEAGARILGRASRAEKHVAS